MFLGSDGGGCGIPGDCDEESTIRNDVDIHWKFDGAKSNGSGSSWTETMVAVECVVLSVYSYRAESIYIASILSLSGFHLRNNPSP